MKFTSRILKLLLLLAITLPVEAQTTVNSVNSPYSSFGLGEMGTLDHPVYVGIGGNNITWCDSTVLNFYNPGSYSFLAKGTPLFSTGISSRLSIFSENGNRYFSNIASVNHFAMAFPISSRFGFAFGLKPFSRRGYDFVSGDRIDEDSIIYVYQGNGGVNEIFFGFAGNIINTNKLKLSLGGNFGYLFGESSNIRRAALYKSAGVLSGYVNEKITDVNSIHYEFGTNLVYKVNEKHQLSLSLVMDPQQSLNSKFQERLYYSPKIYDIDETSQLMTSSDSVDRILTAPEMTVGFNYNLSFPANKNDRKLSSEWAFHGSYTTTDWESYSNPFDSIALLSSSRIAFGIQFTPEVRAIEQKELTKTYQLMKYRIGAYQYSLPYSIGSEQVTDRGITFGLGIPILIESSLSSVNLGFAIGNRGVGAEDVLNESYYSLNLGITIAPGKLRKWFRKPKLN